MILNNINGIFISLASPNQVLNWASRIILNRVFVGEIQNSETINYKTGTPTEKGLFCEKIFGPIFNWKCDCVLLFYNKFIEGCLCKFCGKEINTSAVRRYRMGCIKLVYPILHPWFYKKNNSIFSVLLNITKNSLTSLIYYKYINFINNNIIYSSKFKILNKKFFLNTFNLKSLTIEQYLNINLYIQKYFKELNIIDNIYNIKELLFNINLQYNFNVIKILNVLNLFYLNKIQLFWLIMDIIPVIPSDLRYSIKLSEECFVLSKLNEYYYNIIIHNIRLKKYLLKYNLNTINFEILEKIQLQKSSEILFETSNFYKTNISLAQSLLGKYGRFRQDLLGKRIDFSSRSVIISGYDLNFSQIGVPITIGISLFKPILLSLLNVNSTLKTILKISTIHYTTIVIRRILTRIFKYHTVLVNRSPTLHRMNIQSFKPYLIEGYAIKLYPLACTGFNADFDGDQMSIMLILTKPSRLETKYTLFSDKNIFSPANGALIYKLNQGMVLGLYNILYLEGSSNYYYYFKSIEDILDFLEQNLVHLKTTCWLKYKFYFNNRNHVFFITNIIGKILLFNYLNSII